MKLLGSTKSKIITHENKESTSYLQIPLISSPSPF